MLHHISEDNPDKRLEFCEWVICKLNDDENFSNKIMFNNVANFYVNGEVNRQNIHIKTTFSMCGNF